MSDPNDDFLPPKRHLLRRHPSQPPPMPASAMAGAEGEDRVKRPSPHPHPPPYDTFLPTFTPSPPSAPPRQLFCPPSYHCRQPVSPVVLLAYVGALILLCVGIDRREKPGLVACTIGAILASFVVYFGLSSDVVDW